MLEERKLFVAGLPQQTREGDLRGHFARYGEVVHTRVVLDMASGNSRGFGFVEFADEAATLRALADDEMPNHVFRGRKVMVMEDLLIIHVMLMEDQLDISMILWVLTIMLKIIAKLLPSTSIPQIPQRNDLLTVRLVPTPTRNGVVSAKPAAERGGGCEAVSVQQERGGAEECEVARPRDVLEAPVPYFLCHQHNPLRRRLGDRAEASQDDDASCSFLPWLRLGRYETVTDEDVGSGGGDPAGGRPLRPLAEEATTQRADSGGSESIQGKRDRGRRHGPH
uniref:RRM domain-containing protein n=1 Tax=Oryza rufipogon TaxID=4529 RepID=A0A0E0P1U7_ORYRU